MKKLLIASMAAALTMGAWAAEDVTYTKLKEGFENFSVENLPGLWVAPTDTSGISVKEYGTGEAYTYGTPEGNTAAISGGPGSQYLNLEMDSGSVLKRNFAENAAAVTVDAENAYVVDTLVKFTATDDTPTVNDGDKFILWLKSTEGDTGTTYSLMATCGTISDLGTVSGSTSIALNASVTADQWARVSVKTIKFYNDEEAYGTLGFVVYVDGVVVSAYSAQDYAALFSSVNNNELTEQGADYYSKNQVFPCLISGSTESGSTTMSLTSVGFEGTGAIDDLMIVAASDGDAPAFTAWTKSDVETYTVSFTAIGLAEGTSWQKASETIDSGKELVQPEDPTVTGYTFKGWFSDQACESAITFPLTITQSQTIYALFEVVVDPVAPGETVTGSTEEAAKTALKNAGIKDPFSGITTTQKEAYAALFEATATGSAEAGWTATWTLTEKAEETLTTDANDALAAVLEGVLDADASVEISAQPGLYYTVLYAAEVTADEWQVAGWTMAEGDKVTLTLPKMTGATQGFGKIGITAVKPNAD